MLAALFDGKGKMQLSQIDKPELSAGGVIVELQAVGICGSDLQIKTDQTNKDTFPAGHELAGTIVDVSPEISKDLIGKRVAVEGIGQGRACMGCWYCRSGQYVKCSHRNPRGGGGFAEFLTTQAIGCYELPDSMSWAAGALVEPLSVSVHAVRRGKLKGGETVVVIGAGSIGLTAIAAAKALGAGKLFASSRHSHQTKMATDLGADYAFENDFDSLNEAVLEATQGRGADITIETVGGWNSDAIKQAITTTRKQGRVVIIGGYRAPITLDWEIPLGKELDIIFSHCYSIIDGKHDYEIAIDLLENKSLGLEKMVTHTYPLTKIQEAFNTAYNKKSGSLKVQIQNI